MFYSGFASSRVRSRPLASARLRSPPLASGHLRSTSLAKHILDGPVVGSGGAWVGLGGPWGIVSAHKRVLGIKSAKPGGVTSARAAGRSGSSSETPPLNPPRRSKEVGFAHRHNSRQQGKRYRPATNEGTGNAVGYKADLESTASPPAPPPQKTRPRNHDAQRHQYVAPLMTTVTQDNDAHYTSENGGVEYNTCV